MKFLNLETFCKWSALILLAALGACSTVDVGDAPNLARADSLVVLPIANQTETPEAGQRVRSIAESILHQKGFTDLRHYSGDDGSTLLMGGNAGRVQAEALDWARGQGVHYALTGSVQEWRYKVGIDGEPVVGVTFNLIDVSKGSVVWSATGSRSGWSRSSVAGVAQSLIGELLGPLSPQ